MTRFNRRLAVAVSLLGFALCAQAQVNLMPQLQGRPGGGDPRNQRPELPDAAKYEYGREVFAVKVLCSTCPLADQPLDEKTARRFLADEDLRASLSHKEDDAVVMYLSKVFALRVN